MAKPTASIRIHGQKPKAFPLRTSTRRGRPVSLLPLSAALGVPAGQSDKKQKRKVPRRKSASN